MRSLALLFCFLLPFTASGAVYKWVDANGRVTYSDQPPQSTATPVALPEVQTFHPAAPSSAGATKETTPPDGTPQSSPQDAGYQNLGIVQPQNDATIRESGGNILVQLDLTPELQTTKGHTIALRVDGKRTATTTGTTYTLQNIDRGTHTLQATVENTDGQTLISSNVVMVHLFRAITVRPKN